MTTATGDFVIDFKMLADNANYSNPNLTFLPVGETFQITSGLLNSSKNYIRMVFFDSTHTFTTSKTSRIEKNSPNTAGGECGPVLCDSSGNGYELKIIYDEIRLYRIAAGERVTALGSQINLDHAAGSVFSLSVNGSGDFTATCNGADIGLVVNDTTYPAGTLKPGGFCDRNSGGGGFDSGVLSFGAVGLAASGVTATPAGVAASTAVGTPAAAGGTKGLPVGVAAATAVGTAVAKGAGKAVPSGTSAPAAVGYTLPYIGTASFVTLTSVNTGPGYLGAYASPALEVGDRIAFQTAASLGAALNYIDVDGGIYTDFDGTQSLSALDVSTGFTNQIFMINGDVIASAVPAGVSSGTGVGSSAATGSASAKPAGISASTSVGTTASTIGGAKATPDGVSTTGYVGTVSGAGSVVAFPSGLSMSGAVGTASATGSGLASPAGLSLSDAVGSPGAAGGGTVSTSGVSTGAAVGLILPEGGVAIMPLGVSSQAKVGIATAKVIDLASFVTSKARTVTIKPTGAMSVSGAIIRDSLGRRSSMKDPGALLDYSFDWAPWLAEVRDTISTASFAANGGVVVDSQFEVDGVATAFVSGGTVGVEAGLTCRILTAGGRIDERSLMLVIKEQ